MMFSTKAEYGVRVMVELARRASEAAEGRNGIPAHPAHPANPAHPAHGDPVIPLAEIAEHDGMPLAYLEHLVARLRKAGLLDSRRGSRGGYMLARPADQITMAEVVEALEGNIAPIECISEAPDGSIVCTRESDSTHICPTKLLWTRVRLAIVSTLMQTTLADLLHPTAGRSGDPLAALSAAAEQGGALPMASAKDQDAMPDADSAALRDSAALTSSAGRGSRPRSLPTTV